MENSPPVPAPHFLFVVSGIQGHINPARRLAAHLMASSSPTARVTFSTSVSAHRLLFPSLASPDEEAVDGAGVTYIPHSDGFDDGFKPGVHGMDSYKARNRSAGIETLSAVVFGLAARGRPVTCMVYTFLVVLVPEVARTLGIPAAIYWIQPAAVFTELNELEPKVLVNTFDALEAEALRPVPQLEVVAVGPVVPDDGASLSNTDIFRRDDANACMDWLDTKPARSVVYVSFGTLLSMSKRQEKMSGGKGHAQGMVVEWCNQMKELSHPAVGCFVTHCGWNTALESINRGVPMVAVLQWTDQPTVAWLVEACIVSGVRARLDGEGVVERGELQRCVELIMADGDGIRAKAERWRERAKEAVAVGGSLERNLRAFASEP